MSSKLSVAILSSAEKRSKRQQEAVLDISQNYNEVFISRVLLEFVLNEMNYLNVLKELEVPYVRFPIHLYEIVYRDPTQMNCSGPL